MQGNWQLLKDYNPDEAVDVPVPIPELDIIKTKMANLETKMEAIDQKLQKIIDSNKALISWQKAKAEHNQREQNYHLRGYGAGKLPATSFVAQHSNIDL